MRYLPLINRLYWLTLLAATALGEKLGDVFSMTLGLGYGSSTLLLLALTIGALTLRLFVLPRRVEAYWLALVLTSTIGTTAADFVTRALGLGYAFGAVLLAALLAVLVVCGRLWARQTGRSWRASEALFWIEMLVAGTLGTASGDALADKAQLGYAGSTLVLCGALAALALVSRGPLPRVLLYWVAVLLIDPLGATLGDMIDKPDALGLGVTRSAIILSCTLAIIVAIGARREASRRAAVQSQPRFT
jgi:uncharacterized membrane-anchored protein